MEIEKIAAEIGISGDTLRSLYRTFLESTPKDLAALEDGIARQDVNIVTTSAHHIKGAAINLELLKLAEKAKILENSAKPGNWAELTRLFHELTSAYKQEKEAVEKLLQ
jgi:HPt (histidine-containing phosphotransfer) domain-containing protein